MLNYIHLENFKAFGSPTTIPLAPITLIFGENSAGKSSILQALSLLHQTAQSDDPEAALVFRSPSGLVDLGSFHECLHDHDHRRVMRIGLGVRQPRVAHASRRFRTYTSMTRSVGLHWAFRQKAPGLDQRFHDIELTDGLSVTPIATFRPTTPPHVEGEFAPQRLFGNTNYFRLVGESLSRDDIDSLADFLSSNRAQLVRFLRSRRNEIAKHRGAEPTSMGMNADQLLEQIILLSRESVTEAALREFVVGWTGTYGQEGLLGTGWGGGGETAWMPLAMRLGHSANARSDPKWARSFSDQPLLTLVTRCSIARRRVSDALDRLDTIGPLRTPADRHYTYSGSRPKHVGRRGERVADLLRRDAGALRRTNWWMKRFETGYQLRLRGLGGRMSDVFEVRLIDQRRRPKVNVAFSAVGFGISQLLPILVQSVATKDRVITIEQPELHVHPRLQAEIGDLLVDCVEENGHQFLVETHSEHLILRLRRLVREGKIDAKHISVIYVGRGREGSAVQQIGLKPDGTFDQEWPGGFFPERLRELL